MTTTFFLSPPTKYFPRVPFGPDTSAIQLSRTALPTRSLRVYAASSADVPMIDRRSLCPRSSLKKTAWCTRFKYSRARLRHGRRKKVRRETPAEEEERERENKKGERIRERVLRPRRDTTRFKDTPREKKKKSITAGQNERMLLQRARRRRWRWTKRAPRNWTELEKEREMGGGGVYARKREREKLKFCGKFNVSFVWKQANGRCRLIQLIGRPRNWIFPLFEYKNVHFSPMKFLNSIMRAKWGR